MSLTSLIKSPNIRKAFDEFAIPGRRLPPEFRGSPCLVPDNKGPKGLAGIAFDYLARMKILRECKSADVPIHHRPFLSQQIVNSWDSTDDMQSYYTSQEQLWRRHLDGAHKVAQSYLDGKKFGRNLALKVQYMAHADLLKRNSWAFDNYFKPSEAVADELEELFAQFDPKALFNPKKRIILNPEFAAGEAIGGADGDLIIDDMLVEFKCASRLSVTKPTLLQLVGYKILSDMGEIEGAPKGKPINSFGIYFARYDRFCEIGLDSLFTNEGFENFKKVFLEDYRSLKAAREERKKQLDAIMAKYMNRTEQTNRLEI